MTRRERRSQRGAVLLAGLLVLAAPAAGEEVLVLRDAAGADTSPYQFLPSLVRGGRETLWATTDPGNQHSFETYVRFALPPEVLSGERLVEEAALSLVYSIDMVSFGEGGDEAGILECRPVLESWQEDGTTWSNRPSVGAPVDTISGITRLGPLACDVTPLVQAWADGTSPNHGIAVTNPTSQLMGFSSFEANGDPELEPQLVLVTVPEPSAEAAALAAAGATAALAARRHRRRRAPRAGVEPGGPGAPPGAGAPRKRVARAAA